MAEKPRLKETEEIFSSVGKSAPKPSPLPLDQQGAIPLEEASREEQPALISSLLDPPEPPAGKSSRRASRSRSNIRRGTPELTEPAVDRRPLDFGKYELGKKDEKPEGKPQSQPQPAPDVLKEEDRKPRSQKKTHEQPQFAPKIRRVNPQKEQELERVKTQPESEPAPSARRPDSVAAPELERAQPPPEPPLARRVNPPAEPTPEPSPLPRAVEESEPVIQPFVFEEFGQSGEAPKDSREQAPKILGRAESGNQGENSHESSAPRRKSKQPSPGRDPERERDEILKQLSNKFDEAFNEAFEGKRDKDELPLPGRQIREQYGEQPAPDFEEPYSEPVPGPAPEDRKALEEADSFLQEFAERVQQEEESRTELFKDTLAEKFERERQRYLRELGIEKGGSEKRPREEQRAVAPPAVRRLDVQIEPEMHMQQEERAEEQREKRQDQPVTYSRMGRASPQAGADSPGAAQQPPKSTKRADPPEMAGKKSTEKLLLELAIQKTEASISGRRRPPPRQMETMADNEKLQAPVFVPEIEEPKKKNRKFFKNGKVIAISAVVAAIMLIPLAILIIDRFRPAEGFQGGNSDPAITSSGGALPGEGGGTLEVYESRNFDAERGEYENVNIKRSNVSVKNVSVGNLLLIEGTGSQGEVRLEDVSVDGAIHLRAGAVDRLVLHNVSAERLVINNAQTKVEVSISGNGGLNTVEIKTPAVVSQHPTQGADVASGVDSVLLSAAPEVSVLSVTLSGLEIASLESGGDAILELQNGTRVERLTGEGSMSIRGDGKILSFFAGPRQPGESVVLLLDVGTSHLTLKCPAELTINGMIDSMAASDNFTASGSGAIANLTLNPPVGDGRLQVNLYDLGVMSIIANAEARVVVSGSGHVNELTANKSVYALGNKLNLLIVNANGVIYEVEPDKIQVTSGIRPPETVADNPNLDYNLSTGQISATPDSDADDVTTVCGHPRSSGGYLYGDGSKSNPYQVSTPAQLSHVSLHLSSHFIQTGDVDISTDTQFVTGFRMIAGEGTPFSGSYDGLGNGIYNLRISSSGENVGLFAENTGTIQNISLVSGEVRGTSAERCFVGGICGLNYQGGVINACSNGARVIGSDTAYVGGIAGYNYTGRIRDCYNAAKLTGSDNIGGLAGVNSADATLSGSYNVGTIEGVSAGTGAVVGVNGGVVTNTYYLTDTAPAGIGSGEGTAVEKDTDAMSSAQTVADLSAGNEASPWARSESSYTYPVLKKPEYEIPGPTD